MRFLILRSLSAIGCLTALALMGLIPPAAADGVYHSEHIDLIPIGGAPLRSGFVENIHVNGPEIFALERYVLSGASPNTTYLVTLHIGDTSCATTPLVLQSVAFQTNLAGDGVGELSLPPSAIPPSSHGLTFGVVWELTNHMTLAYETACSIVTLD